MDWDNRTASPSGKEDCYRRDTAVTIYISSGNRANMAVHQTETFTLTATGDAILTREISPYVGVADEFDDLVSLLREADASVTNLEVTVHDYEPAPAATSGGTYMRGPPKVLDELTALGCNMFSAATNHSYDFGPEGVVRTLGELEQRDIVYAGLGHTLYEARRPQYLETPAGRVAIVSACSSISAGSSAGEQTRALRGRPGINPLSVDTVYHLPEPEMEQLRELSEKAGIETMKQSWRDRGLGYGHDWDEAEYFHFGDLKFDAVSNESEAGIAYDIDSADRQAITDWIAEADRTADWVVASLHTHQGVEGRQTTAETPDFVTEFAHDCVDSGADIFLSHGPHVLRGIEVYDGAPIFYSLGNFIVQTETVERLPPENYNRYGLDDYTKVSGTSETRFFDSEGEQTGDLASSAYWETIVPRCTFDATDGLESVELFPCSLQEDAGRPQRGIPVLAEEDRAGRILTNLADLSEPFGTTIDREGTVGEVQLE